jgi:3,4-dihydroxy 2-butanone 4-phosphate synthase / GTP cyclohydrolase II
MDGMPIARVETALEALRKGEFVVVADDTERENEGDLIIVAQNLTAEKLAFMLRHTSGVVCVALTASRANELGLPLMVAENDEPHRTQFTVSVDLAKGISTGISAADRSRTIRALGSRTAVAANFSRPGHVFPLRARPLGVLERRGHTEAAVDLARLAGFEPVGALCELMADDGSMLRGRALREFARLRELAYLQIDDLVTYRRATEKSAGVAQNAASQHSVLPGAHA